MFHSEQFDELAPSQVVLGCCTFHDLRGTFWLSDLVFPGLSDAVEASTFGSLTRYRDTKFSIGFDFDVTSFFTCIFWCSFRHRFKIIDGTEMADVEQNTKDDSIHHVWNFPLSLCVRIGSWCRCIWFGSWCLNWFYQTTNQEQLCGFWKHVS